MAAPPFKVKALYQYDSPHDDDLSFPEGQIITVTEEEDADWWVGEYKDASGDPQSGLFPKNFVEKFEPAAPPRPTRPRPKPAEPPVAAAAPAPIPEPEPPAPKAQPVPESPPAAREPEPRPSAPSPAPAPVSKAPAAETEPPPAPKPAPAQPAAKQPPPVSEKPSSFKDRIAAFNKGTAAPVAPFKPSSSSTGFIKKPFVAPPPSRNAYVPPPREAAAPQKVYRRDEDPEIAERKAEDEEAAERAGLGPATQMTGEAEGEDAPKPTSLKERIAMLQKQQAEQASRRADISQKKKPERPPKKRTESQGPAEGEGAGLEKIDTGETERPSTDSTREMPPQPVRKQSMRPAEPEPFSDGGNDADQSAAGETTEDAGTSSTAEEDEAAKRRHSAAPAHEPDVGDEEEDDEEDEEDEVDEETKRQLALRERMAKLSGGMGMGGMFGGMGGKSQAGASAGAKKKKPAPHPPERRATGEEESPVEAAQHPGMRMVPIPGMGRPQMSRGSTQVEHEDEDLRPITGAHAPEEVADVEDVARPPKRSSTERSAPPVPSQRPVSQGSFGAPPVLGGRPSLDGMYSMYLSCTSLLIFVQLDRRHHPHPAQRCLQLKGQNPMMKCQKRRGRTFHYDIPVQHLLRLHDRLSLVHHNLLPPDRTLYPCRTPLDLQLPKGAHLHRSQYQAHQVRREDRRRLRQLGHHRDSQLWKPLGGGRMRWKSRKTTMSTKVITTQTSRHLRSIEMHLELICGKTAKTGVLQQIVDLRNHHKCHMRCLQFRQRQPLALPHRRRRMMLQSEGRWK